MFRHTSLALLILKKVFGCRHMLFTLAEELPLLDCRGRSPQRFDTNTRACSVCEPADGDIPLSALQSLMALRVAGLVRSVPMTPILLAAHGMQSNKLPQMVANMLP